MRSRNMEEVMREEEIFGIWEWIDGSQLYRSQKKIIIVFLLMKMRPVYSKREITVFQLNGSLQKKMKPFHHICRQEYEITEVIECVENTIKTNICQLKFQLEFKLKQFPVGEIY